MPRITALPDSKSGQAACFHTLRASRQAALMRDENSPVTKKSTPQRSGRIRHLPQFPEETRLGHPKALNAARYLHVPG
jgi:hypothetical protein